MTIAPDQASELLDGAKPGPWYVHADQDVTDGTFIYDDTGNMCIAVEPSGSDYREADLLLAAAAPDLAQTIAGMRWQWGLERDYRSGTETDTVWFSSEDEAREDLSNPHRQHGNPRLVRRLVGPAEVAE
ncbi:hypothetical protein [Corynebacterium variabile]|uniref:hypothetical protein n=1 Tax=Corynebacterium variabile TaxID=1727 RepID=UPI0028A22447|nr:hypothetical protein [Corynebacterium variabile]